MSNFLQQFENRNTSEKSTSVVKEPKTRTEKSQLPKIQTAEHVIEVDETHHKRKMIRYGIIGGAVLGVLFLAIFLFRMVNRVEVRDFVGVNIQEARTWGLSNRITIEDEQKFNLELEEGQIIEQNKKPSSHLQRGSVLKVVVSLGPNMEEVLELPNFSEMTTGEVQAWRQEWKAFNVRVNEEYHNEIEKGKFIRQEFSKSETNAGNYTRADGLIVYMSKGKEVFPENISVPNFQNQSKEQVEKWAEENEIKITYAEKSSDKVQPDFVISQSVEAGEKVAKHSEMTITLSIGKSVVVPNFASFTMEEAGNHPSLAVLVRERYHSSVSYGGLIDQSEPAGKELIGDEMSVTVTYSLGRPYLGNLAGESEKILPELFHNLTSRGANITYTVTYVDSAEPKGTIVSTSPFGQWLGMSDHVQVRVSRGNLQPPTPQQEKEESQTETPDNSKKAES